MAVDLGVIPEWEILGEFVHTQPGGRNEKHLNVRCHCGAERAANKTSVLSGRSRECTSCAQTRRRMKRRASTHVGLLTRLYFNDLKAGAKRRKLQFEVTQQELWDLFLAQDGTCALTGKEINLSTKLTKNRRTDYSSFNASLDRIDSSVGYNPENVQWVHRNFNQMKWDLTQDEFINNCRDVAAYADNNQEKQ